MYIVVVNSSEFTLQNIREYIEDLRRVYGGIAEQEQKAKRTVAADYLTNKEGDEIR